MKTVLWIVGGVAVLVVGVAVLGGWLFFKGLTTPGSPIQEGFDKSFRASCEAEATKKGVTQEVAHNYCECTLAKFKETKSMEKAVNVCAAQVHP